MPDLPWEREEPRPAEPSQERRREQGPSEVPEILRGGGDARQRLKRIEDGDPLEIGARTQRRLREECLFLDPERLTLRAMARAAILAAKYEGVPGLDDWLNEILSISIADLLGEQEREEYSRIEVMDSVDKDFYLRFASFSKLPAKYGRLACLVMNQLPKEDRRNFFAVCIDGKSINRWAAEGNGPPQRIKQSLKSIGLKMLSVIERADRNGGDGGIAHGI